MQAKTNTIVLKPQKQPKLKDAIDTIDTAYKAHLIQKSVCTESRKYYLSCILAKFDGNISPDGQWTSAIQKQDPLFQRLPISLLRSHHLKCFGIYLASSISNDRLAQQLSLHHYTSWLLDNGWGNHFIDQVAHGLHVCRSLPRMCHSLLEASSAGNIPNFPLLRNCSSGNGSS